VLDLEVIKLLSDKDSYIRYNKLINKGALGEEASNIVKALGKWHDESVGSFSWTKFAAWFGLVLHSKMDASKMAVYKELFKALEDDPTFDPASNHLVLQSLIKRDFATKAAETALSIADGGSVDLDSAMSAILADYRKAADKVEGVSKYIVGSDIIGMVGVLKSPGLHWRLECLNEAVGELRKGDFVAISTRPDTG
jgi:replicative DNA helicase